MTSLLDLTKLLAMPIEISNEAVFLWETVNFSGVSHRDPTIVALSEDRRGV